MAEKDVEMFAELQRVHAEMRSIQKNIDEHPVKTLPGCVEAMGFDTEFRRLAERLHELSLKAERLRKTIRESSATNVVRLDDFRPKS